MSAKVEQHCTLLVSHNDAKGTLPSTQEIEERLQSSSAVDKAEALKALIHMIMTGEEQTRLLMTVIRYCLNTDDHKVQKLLQLYWEVVEKYNPEGGLREEMILVCNALLKNLQHANEFLRGCTLRFLCRLKEPELVGPLVPTIEENLEHRHPYVRKNAAAAVHILYTTFGEGLVPDAVEAMHRFLLEEEDPAAMRNAFLMLATHKPDLALGYVADNLERVPTFGVGMQQQVLELIRRECRQDAQRRATYGKVLFALLSSSSAAVAFEAAGALVILSSAPLAVSKAAQTYTHLLSTHADTNVKLVVLERLSALRKLHPRVLEESLMDVARSLQNPNLDIRQKTLDIVLQLVSARSAETLVSLLRKEVLATQDGAADEDAGKYRGMLIRAIHRCAVRFPAVSGRVVLLLLDFVHSDGALEVMTYVREVAQTQPALLPAVLEKLVQNLDSMTDAPAMRVALWVLGEFSSGAAVQPAVDAVLGALGARDGARLVMDADSVAKLSLTNGDVAPRATDEREGGREATLATGAGVPGGARRNSNHRAGAGKPKPAAPTGPATLADGTYASQAAVVAEEGEAAGEGGDASDGSALRWHVLHGNFFLAAVCASTLTKLALRARRDAGADRVRGLVLEVMMVLCDLAELGVPGTPRFAPDADTREHIKRCLALLLETTPDAQAETDLLSEPRRAWGGAMSSVASPGARAAAEAEEAKAKAALEAEPRMGADTLVSFRQLRTGSATTGAAEMAMDDAGDLTRATGTGAEADAAPRRVQQLTGPGDAVYVEAEVTVHDFDILLRVTVRNQTAETLSNCSLDLFTQGDMKLVERTQPFTLAGEGAHVVSLSVKVSSTEKGCVFGSVQFDHSTRAETSVLQLDAIALDLMDYMRPASCDEFAFRTMWAKFEWENKLPVNTLIPSMHDFLRHVTDITRMRCLTPAAALEGEADFLSANLYATTVFGEHALLNISLERHPTSRRIVGFVRIRSKAQGIALKLGDIVTANQQRARTTPKTGDNPGKVSA